MRDVTTLRLELGISAERLVSQVLVDNRQLEDRLTAGIKKGLEELLNEDGLDRMIADAVKEEVRNTIRQASASWSLKHKIHEAIFNQLDEKVAVIAKDWGDKMLAQIEAKPNRKNT